MTKPDPLDEARKRVSPFLEGEEKWFQDALPGMEDYWCEDRAPYVDYGEFEYGDSDE